jgi:hypothetical protein
VPDCPTLGVEVFAPEIIVGPVHEKLTPGVVELAFKRTLDPIAQPMVTGDVVLTLIVLEVFATFTETKLLHPFPSVMVYTCVPTDTGLITRGSVPPVATIVAPSVTEYGAVPLITPVIVTLPVGTVHVAFETVKEGMSALEALRRVKLIVSLSLQPERTSTQYVPGVSPVTILVVEKTLVVTDPVLQV